MKTMKANGATETWRASKAQNTVDVLKMMTRTEESSLVVALSVSLTHDDPRDLGLVSVVCLVKKHKIHFRILSDLRIQSWIVLIKKRTL